MSEKFDDGKVKSSRKFNRREVLTKVSGAAVAAVAATTMPRFA